jgi:hypothetical protein
MRRIVCNFFDAENLLLGKASIFGMKIEIRLPSGGCFNDGMYHVVPNVLDAAKQHPQFIK